MRNITEFLPLIKEQIVYNTRNAEKYGPGNPRSEPFLKRVSDFTELYDTIESFNSASPTTPAPSENNLTLAPKDLEGLPPELIEQLSAKIDEFESNILSVVNQNGGIATLDQILIGLFRIDGEVRLRTKLNSKIYRMTQKGLLEGVEGKKAVYKIP